MIVSRRSFLTGIGGIAMLPATAAAASRPPTPQETMGPFYPVRRLAEHDADLTRVAGQSGRAAGEVIELFGRVIRRDGSPVADASIAVWQANAAGRYAHAADTNLVAPLDPNFQGHAEIRSGRDGEYRFVTVKPAPYPATNGTIRAPHVHFDVSGADARVVTQMYFPGEALNATDFLRSTMAGRSFDPALLTATRADGREPGVAAYRWDIVLLDPA